MARKDVIQIIIDAVDNVSGMFEDIEKTARRSMKNAQKATERADRSFKDMGDTVDDLSDQFKENSRRMEEAEHAFSDSTDGMRESCSRMASSYERDMNRMGGATDKFATMSAAKMERYKAKFLASVDRMNAKATQSSQMMGQLGKNGAKYVPILDKGFLRVGNRLEEMARSGHAANLAIEMLGRNASMKDLYNQIKMINKGVGRMRTLVMGMGIAMAVVTYGVILLSNEVDGRLVPAFEHFKEVWLDALTPFAKMWTTYVGLPILKAATAIGKFIDYLNSINPNISAVGGMFLWLTGILTLLLSPLAIGIARGLAMKAAFAALWKIIGPFVLALLRVAGAAMFWSAVIIGVVATIRKLWQTHEGFRNAVINVWNAIKDAVSQVVGFLKPYLLAAWNAITGGAETTLPKIGDVLAKVLNFMADAIRTFGPVIVDALKAAFQMAGDLFKTLKPIFDEAISLIKSAWNGLKAFFGANGGNMMDGAKNGIQTAIGVIKSVFYTVLPAVKAVVSFIMARWNEVKSWFAANGPGMIAGLKTAWNTIKPAVAAVVAFIKQIWGTVTAFFQQHGPMIMEAAGNVFTVIGAIIKTAMMVIMAVMQFVWPFVKMLIISVWNNIKGVIQGAIGVILSIIQIFSALFTGNWGALWDGILNLLKSAWQLIWNGFQLLLFGRFVKGVMALGSALKGIFTGSWNAIKGFLTSIWSSIVSAAKSLWNGLKSTVSTLMKALGNVLKGIWNSIKGVAVSVWNGIKAVASSVWNAMKSTVTSIAKAIWNAVKSAFTSMANTVKSIWNGIKSAASSAWNSIKSTISNGVKSAWSTIKGYAGSFLSAGKSLLEALAKGIRNGISACVSAISSGMKKIRSFLPFSPAKVGPLSDLDKSGESLWPTFAGGVAKKVRPMVRAVEAGMAAASNALTAAPTITPRVSPLQAMAAAAPVAQGVSTGGGGSTRERGERPSIVNIHFHNVTIEGDALAPSRTGRSRFAEQIADMVDRAGGRLKDRRGAVINGRRIT